MTQKDFQKLYDEHKNTITDADIKRELEELYSIAKDNEVFLVTVVGSSNAGKSTFFNCIVNAEKDITETNSDECTIRPIFAYPDSKFTFKTYRRFEGQSNTHIDINNVLKFFMDGKEKLISNELNLTIKDDKSKIEEYVEECQNSSNNLLFASFSINNKESQFVEKLKGKNVVFVDMPGDDGPVAAETRDVFYDTILRRTDLVLLVCSSTQIVGVSLNEYLEVIQKNNPKVPFIIAFNYHDDNSYCPTEAEQQHQLEELANHLTKYNIEKKYYYNALYTHTKRFNGRYDEYKKNIIDQEAEKFHKFEVSLYNSFFDDKDDIRKKIEDNRDNRFQAQLKLFITTTLTNKIDKLQKEEDDFETFVKQLEYSEKDLMDLLQNKRKEDSSLISDIKESFNGEFRILKYKFRKLIENKIKETIIPKELQIFIDEQVKNYKKGLLEKIKEDKNIDITLNSLPPNLLELEERKNHKYLTKKFYKSKIDRVFLYYDAENLEHTLKGLRNKLYTMDCIGHLIVETCNQLKKDAEQNIRAILGNDGRDNLLKHLKELKSKLLGQ